MLKCIDKICCAGGKANEDFVLVTDRFALVLDGSTNLNFYKGQPDAGWFVSSFATAFYNCFDENDIKGTVQNALEQARLEYIDITGKAPEEEQALPSASFSVIYEHNGKIVVALLGDCTVFAYPKTGVPYTLRQGQVERFDQAVIAEMQKIKETTGTPLSQAVSLPYIKELLKKNRGLMNTEEGYWILSFCRQAVENISVYTVPADSITHIMSITDGFETVGDLFMQGVPQKSLAEIHADKVRAEQEDPEFDRFPRFKLHDDASCVLLRVTE